MNASDPNERELQELAELYRQLPRVEPPPALDAKILAHARAAVASSHGPSSRPRARARWPAAMATAAVLCLAVGLGWRLRDQVGQDWSRATDSSPVTTDAIADSKDKSVLDRAEAPTAGAGPASPAASTEAAPPAAMNSAPAPAAPIVAEPQADAPTDNAIGELASREAERGAARETDGVIAQEPAPPGFVADAPAAREEQRAIDAEDSRRRSSEAVDALAMPAPQTAPAPPAMKALRKAEAPPAANEAQDDSEKLESIEVTGSRIKRTDLETSQPVFVLEAELPEKKVAEPQADADRAPRRDVGASAASPAPEAKQDQRLQQAPAPPPEPEPVIAEEVLAAPPPPPPPAPAAPPASAPAAVATPSQSAPAPAYDYSPDASSNDVERATTTTGREAPKPVAGLGLTGTTAKIDRATEKTWFEGIRTLIARGQLREAREELKALRERHPRAEVPRDIEDALR